MTTRTQVKAQLIQNSHSPEDSRKRRHRFFWLLMLLIPACLWLTAQVALLGLGTNRVEDTVLSSMAADYSQWQPQRFNPLKPDLIGTIRADQLTLVALPGVNTFGTIVPFIPFGTGTPITEVPSATPTATPTPTLATRMPTPTPTLVTIWPPLWTDTPIATVTTVATPIWTSIPPTPIPPTAMPQVDLAIMKDDSILTAIPGQPLAYTVTVTNNGSQIANGATVTDTFPAGIDAGSITWTCGASAGSSCGTPAGNGNINTNVNLQAGGTATFTAHATVSPSATGTLANTAIVAPPSGMVDPNPGNNSFTDTDTLTPTADLAISKTDDRAKAWPGGTLTYTIAVINNGPSDVTGATITDTFPGSLNSIAWNCIAGGGASCTPTGTGSINDIVILPAGGTLNYTATGTVNTAASGNLSNTANVTPPGGVPDPDMLNNSATDTDAISLPTLVITLTWGNITNTIADLDLWAVEPSGSTISYNDPLSPSGGQLGTDVNCGILEPANTVGSETISWPGAPLGTYTINPYYYGTCSSGWINPVDWTITVTVDGTPLPTFSGQVTPEPPPTPPDGVPFLPTPISFTLD